MGEGILDSQTKRTCSPQMRLAWESSPYLINDETTSMMWRMDRPPAVNTLPGFRGDDGYYLGF